MKLVTLLAMLLLTTSTQAGVFKCKAPNGFIYSEKPCPDGATAGQVKVIPASGDSIDKAPSNVTPPEISGGAGKAYPPITEKQRPGYERHLSQPNPKALIICANGVMSSIVGQASFVQKQLASLPAGCSPYSIDDAVVWVK